MILVFAFGVILAVSYFFVIMGVAVGQFETWRKFWIALIPGVFYIWLIIGTLRIFGEIILDIVKGFKELK